MAIVSQITISANSQLFIEHAIVVDSQQFEDGELVLASIHAKDNSAGPRYPGVCPNPHSLFTPMLITLNHPLA